MFESTGVTGADGLEQIKLSVAENIGFKWEKNTINANPAKYYILN